MRDGVKLGHNVQAKGLSDIGDFMGESHKSTQRIMKLNDLIPELQELVSEGKLGTTAGERRLRACKFLEYPQIEVRVMAVEDEEHQLKLEISENENRKEFSYSERMDWAKRLERIERIKAKERMGEGTENFPELELGETRDVVGAKSGFGSGKQYEKAKFIHENADEEVIEQLDKEDISIHKAWLETKAKLEAEVEEEKINQMKIISQAPGFFGT